MENGTVKEVSPGVYHLELNPEQAAENAKTVAALAASLRSAVAYDKQICTNNLTYFDRLYELEKK